MAGRVAAHFEIHGNGQSWDIVPMHCPAMDEHRQAAVEEAVELAPRCQTANPFNGRRTCPFWYATTSDGNSCERLDGSILWERAAERGKTQMRCGVLCIAARRNRPPGV